MFFVFLMVFFILVLTGLELLLAGQYMIGVSSFGVIPFAHFLLKTVNLSSTSDSEQRNNTKNSFGECSRVDCPDFDCVDLNSCGHLAHLGHCDCSSCDAGGCDGGGLDCGGCN